MRESGTQYNRTPQKGKGGRGVQVEKEMTILIGAKVESLMFGAYFLCEQALRQLSDDHFGNWLPAHLVALILMGTVTLVLWRHLPAIEMLSG